jgi:hypothetical protein
MSLREIVLTAPAGLGLSDTAIYAQQSLAVTADVALRLPITFVSCCIITYISHFLSFPPAGQHLLRLSAMAGRQHVPAAGVQRV